jgi:myosin heavy subunit
MSEQPSKDDSVEFDIDGFCQWVERTAEANGVSQDALIEELMSSYWIFDEITKVVEEADSDTAGIPPDNQAYIDDLVDSGDDEVQLEGATEPEEASSLDTTVSTLLKQVTKLSTELKELRTQHTQQMQEVSSCLTALDERLTAYEQRLDDVESGSLPEVSIENQDEIENFQERIEETEEQLTKIRMTQSELETRLETEFDNIERVFERIFTETDRLESDLDELKELYRNEVEQLQEQQAERQELVELRKEANRLNSTRGKCQKCGEIVVLSLLDTPTCPYCDHVFEDIVDNSWLPFGEPTLITASPRVASISGTENTVPGSNKKEDNTEESETIGGFDFSHPDSDDGGEASSHD